ncbi:MAG: RNA polymerase sporulation sigma factor SigG [Oscillospiraceae bacterium]|nr:RNA polymerase sporulation sigma factor SigG [Oscillospiraceae bacterium]
MQGKVEICGVNTAKLGTLKAGETEALLRRSKAGDRAARQKLIEGNLRLVLSVIQRFSGRGENPDDLFQVGCVGLLKAINNFDPDLDVKFSTYGVPMICGEIRRYLRDNSPIRVSRSVRDTAYRVLQCKERLMAELGREATMEELAKAMDLPLATVCEAMDAVSAPVSLYEPVHSDSGYPLLVMDQIRDPKSSDERWLEELALRDALAALGEREKHILALRYYDGKTQVEVANAIGISQAQVSRLEKGALSRLKKAIVS